MFASVIFGSAKPVPVAPEISEQNAKPTLLANKNANKIKGRTPDQCLTREGSQVRSLHRHQDLPINQPKPSSRSASRPSNMREQMRSLLRTRHFALAAGNVKTPRH
jgi:hypothetical protein